MLITIGRAVKPHGVRGEMKIETLTDVPERFTGLQRVYLVSSAGREIPCSVDSVRYAGREVYLKFEGYGSPEKARELNGWYIKVPQEEAAPLPEGSYYWFEVIGMEVVAESGEKLGTISDIFETGSNDVYVLKRGRQEIYLPATKEIIRQVDRAQKRITIHVTEGLLD
ncbi:MAG TPA: ribosome maturation factor RimM [Nitrospirota bacterium]|nr:ribosome maturation factor RimM [Nitrospirota bacterium]